jgi:hypothetical protein
VINKVSDMVKTTTVLFIISGLVLPNSGIEEDEKKNQAKLTLLTPLQNGP